MAKAKKSLIKTAGSKMKKASKKAGPYPDKKSIASKRKKSEKKATPMPATRAVRAIPLTVSNACTCMKFGRFYYCMVEKPDGSFERCPTLSRFKTLEECLSEACT